MKTRIIILLAASAIVTLSFTFVSVKRNTPVKEVPAQTSVVENEPVGGFVAEDPR